MVSVWEVTPGSGTPSSTPSASYTLGKRRIEDGHAVNLAQNDYGRNEEQSRFRRAYANMATNYKRSRENMGYARAASGFSAKGGQATRDLSLFNEQKGQAFDGQQDAYRRNMNQITFARDSLLRNRADSLDNLELSEAERRAQLAAQIRDF